MEVPDSKEVEQLRQARTAIEKVLKENEKLKRALCELDTGGGNYLTSRKDLARLSGLGVMSSSWVEHLAEIERKLNIKDKPND